MMMPVVPRLHVCGLRMVACSGAKQLSAMPLAETQVTPVTTVTPQLQCAFCALFTAGVRLADGRVFKGKTVISNATRWDTFEGMVGKSKMPESEKLFR
jgi:hypothetical protein